jgi:hypothetical protein
MDSVMLSEGVAIFAEPRKDGFRFKSSLSPSLSSGG